MDGLLEQVTSWVQQHAVGSYYVGGCVRDLLRGAPTKDVDLAVRGDTGRLGRALAQEFDGHFFWLRREEGVCRVLLGETDELQLDLSPLAGEIDEDLRQRDLTINALAMAVSGGFRADSAVVDVSGGLNDLREGVLRLPTADALDHDPLRALRVVRFRQQLGFHLAPDLEAALRQASSQLGSVSGERQRDELFLLLGLPAVVAALHDLSELRLLERLVPAGTRRAPDDRPRPASAVAALLDRIGGVEDARLEARLAETSTRPRRRAELMRWLAVLWALGAPERITAAKAAKHLSLSARERLILHRALDGFPVAVDLLRRWPVPGRERFRLWQTTRDAEVECILLAGLSAAVDAAPWQALLAEALSSAENPHEFLLTGEQVMQALGTSAGPVVGRWLQAVEEERADGRLRTVDVALHWLRMQVEQGGETGR